MAVLDVERTLSGVFGMMKGISKESACKFYLVKQFQYIPALYNRY